MGAEPGNVLHGVAGGMARTKCLGADIHRIGSAVDGFNAYVCRAGRGQQLYQFHDS